MYSLSDIYYYSDLLGIPEEFIPKNSLLPYTVDLELFGSKGATGYPDVKITANKEILFQGTIKEIQNFQFSINPTQTRQMFRVEFLNKNENDTVVKNDQIIQDKFVQIKKLSIDQLNLEPTKYFRYAPVYNQGYLDYNPDPVKILYTDFLGFNGAVKVYFEMPVLNYFARTYFHSGEYLKHKVALTQASFKNLANLFKGIKP
jgi:hypothetical protein